MSAQQTQISQGIDPVWSLFHGRSVGSQGPNDASCDHKDSDQTVDG